MTRKMFFTVDIALIVALLFLFLAAVLIVLGLIFMFLVEAARFMLGRFGNTTLNKLVALGSAILALSFGACFSYLLFSAAPDQDEPDERGVLFFLGGFFGVVEIFGAFVWVTMLGLFIHDLIIPSTLEQIRENQEENLAKP